MTQKHTPLPWRAEYGGGYGKGAIKANRPYPPVQVLSDFTVAQCHLPLTAGAYDFAECEANARFIVQAVNAHDALLAALVRLIENDGDCDFTNELVGPPETCPGLVDPMYLTECIWCEGRSAIAKARPGGELT